MNVFRKSLVLAILVFLCSSLGFAQEVVKYRFNRSGKDYWGLMINSQPSGADVVINGKAMGKTPLRLERGYNDTVNYLGGIDVVDAYNFVISFSKQGYEDCSKAIKMTSWYDYNGSIDYGTNYPVIEASLVKLSEPVKRENDINQNANANANSVNINNYNINGGGGNGGENSGNIDNVLRWKIQSDPNGARIFWRIISNTQEVKSTNENFLASTPYEETRSFNIPGLTYENSNHVTMEIKVTKRGYVEQVKRFNLRMALDQQEINTFFELYAE